MAYTSYKKLWENELDKIVSKKDTVQDMKTIQLKLEVHDTYKKDDKLTTNFEPNNDIDVKKSLPRFKFFQSKRSNIAIGKTLQPILITIRQTICRRKFISKSYENNYTITL